MVGQRKGFIGDEKYNHRMLGKSGSVIDDRQRSARDSGSKCGYMTDRTRTRHVYLLTVSRSVSFNCLLNEYLPHKFKWKGLTGQPDIGSFKKHTPGRNLASGVISFNSAHSTSSAGSLKVVANATRSGVEWPCSGKDEKQGLGQQ